MKTRALLIGLFFGAFVFAQTALAQTPSPTPAQPECDIPVQRQVDTKLKILAKPEPKFSRRDRERYRGQEINLRATFCGSGKVTDIVVTTGLTDEMDAQAIDAARLIQFTPAEKDGKKVSQLLMLKYFAPN